MKFNLLSRYQVTVNKMIYGPFYTIPRVSAGALRGLKKGSMMYCFDWLGFSLTVIKDPKHPCVESGKGNPVVAVLVEGDKVIKL